MLLELAITTCLWTPMATMPASSSGQDGESSLEGFRGEAAGAIEQMIEWCQSKRLYRTRNEYCELLLQLVPEQPEAMRYLGYKKGNKGWKAPRRPPTARDLKKNLDAIPAQRTTIFESVCTELEDLLASGVAELRPGEEYELALLLSTLDPDSELAREVAGEVDMDGRWVLAETAAARRHRELYADVGDQLQLEVADPVPDPQNEFEQGQQLSWTDGVRTPRARVHGCTDPDEIEETAIAIESAFAISRLLLKVEPQRWLPDFTSYLFPDELTGIRFLMTYVPDDEKGSLTDLVGYMSDSPARAVAYSEHRERRLDGMVRRVLGLILNARFGKVQAWVTEGFGLALGQRITHTTLTWFVSRDRYGTATKDLESRLFQRDSDWMAEARRLLAEGTPLQLDALLPTKLNAMSAEQYVYAFALATYFIEARPDEIVPLLSRLGKQELPPDAMLAATGMDVPLLEKRLTRWLQEMGSLEGEESRAP